jgi:drug/metabolite transporter (DMT)-like permease
MLLSTVPTVTKYVFQHSSVDPLGMALIRVMIGFVFLLAITLVQDRRGLRALTAGDVFRLTLLGGLGVGSYVIAAWGLRLTSVTHYILIYSLVSPLTALFSVMLKKSESSPLRMIGIVISLVGGGIAMSEKLTKFQTDFGLGDLLILLFTIMMAAHLVWSANIVKRFGAMTANTVMFGSSAFLLFLGALV